MKRFPVNFVNNSLCVKLLMLLFVPLDIMSPKIELVILFFFIRTILDLKTVLLCFVLYNLLFHLSLEILFIICIHFFASSALLMSLYHSKYRFRILILLSLSHFSYLFLVFLFVFYPCFIVFGGFHCMNILF